MSTESRYRAGETILPPGVWESLVEQARDIAEDDSPRVVHSILRVDRLVRRGREQAERGKPSDWPQVREMWEPAPLVAGGQGRDAEDITSGARMLSWALIVALVVGLLALATAMGGTR